MIETTTKYICDYCENEVSLSEYECGLKININVIIQNPKSYGQQVASQEMNICKNCSERLGIVNSEEYHNYTYSQGSLRNAIGQIRVKIIDMFYKKESEE